MIVVGAGLPHLPAVLSASKSYSERLFRYQRIDRLPREAADRALAAPAAEEDAAYDRGRAGRDVRRDRRLPLLHPGLRQGGLGPRAALADHRGRRRGGRARGRGRAGGRLLRLALRAGDAGGARLPARDGRRRRRRRPGPTRSTRSARRPPPTSPPSSGKKPQSLSPARDALLKKGLIYSGSAAGSRSPCRTSGATCASTREPRVPMAGKTRSWWGWGNVEDAVTGEKGQQLTGRGLGAAPERRARGARGSAGRVVRGARQPGPAAAGAHRADVRGIRRIDWRTVTAGVPRRRTQPARRPRARPRPGRPAAHRGRGRRPAGLVQRGGIAAIPYGGGSSVVGGIDRASTARAVTIDLGALDQVLEIDTVSRAARIQAGVYGPHLEDQLRPHGLTLRHFPQSFAFSTLGGWLATRAGGHFATLLHPHRRPHRVDAGGHPVGRERVAPPPRVGRRAVSGPAVPRLRGHLGVITEAWMRLQDRPRWQVTASVAFDDYDAAVTRDAGHRPVRPPPLQLPAARLGRGTAQRGDVGVRRPAGRWPSSRRTIRSTRGWIAHWRSSGPRRNGPAGRTRRGGEPVGGRRVELAVLVPADALPA